MLSNFFHKFRMQLLMIFIFFYHTDSICKICCQIFSDKVELKHHREECKVYPYQPFVNRRNPSQSKPSSKYNKLYVCHYNGCNKTFYELGPFNNHKKIHFKLFSCNVCTKSFGAKKDLKIHQRIHKDERPEICKFCSQRFKDPAALRKHTKYLHSEVTLRPYICRKCKKAFSRKHTLQKHYKLHRN